MQELLLDYLSINKACFITDLGVLSLKSKPSSSIFGEQKIAAPIFIIEFEEKNTGDNTFVKYIAASKHLSVDDANLKIKNFSESIHSLKENEVYEIPDLGKFSKDEEDKLVFAQTNFPNIFSPTVHATRVVHPNDSHSMLVGDTQTSTAAMTEYYASEEPSKKLTWWLWAILLAVLAIVGLVFYLMGYKHTASFGNTNQYQVRAADSTYMLPK